MKINHLRIVTLMELKRVWNDKRLVLTLVLGPVIVCTVFGFIAYRSPQGLDVTVYVDDFYRSTYGESLQVQQIISDIDQSETFSVTDVNSLQEATQRLDKGDTRAIIIITGGEDCIESVKVVVDITDPSIYYAVSSQLTDYFTSYSTSLSLQFLTVQGMALPQIEQAVSPFTTTFETNSWKEIKFFDFYASALIILLAICLPLGLAAPSITSERGAGTIERIFASPYKRSEIITGKMMAYAGLATIIIILMIVTLKIVFDVTLGNIGLVLLVTILVGINAVIFGLLISSVTYSESESVLLAIMFFLGFIIQITYLIPWESMHVISKYISYVIPYTYGVQAIRHINLVGAGFSDIWLDLVILVGFIVVQALIATQLLKREIK